MADIRKRTGKNGTTYQVRYATTKTKSGYAYGTFETLKEARAFREDAKARKSAARVQAQITSVDEAITRWLNTCEFEGRDGKDPVSQATLEVYRYRAGVMRAYPWNKQLQELEAPDVVAFRSWLLQNYSRDLAQKVLSSFHSVLLEMVAQGLMANDPAVKISVRQSRYKEPVRIPSVADAQTILRTADELANHRNQSIAKPWGRYRAIIYLAADSGMRPQEYLGLPMTDLMPRGVRVTQAVDRSNEIGPTKTRAGRRYIPVGSDTLEIVTAYLKNRTNAPPTELVFPGAHGEHQPYNKFLRRGWHTLMEKAGFMVEEKIDQQSVRSPTYTPYSLRHFYASMLIAQNRDLKTIQERMGHEDAAMTLNIYGHLIRMKHAEELDEPHGVVSEILRCGKSVAHTQ